MRTFLVVTLLVTLLAAPFASPAGPVVGTAPSFTVFQAPIGLGGSAGEPSIGVNPATGNVFLQAYSETLRVVFDDSVAPAAVTWKNVGSGPQASAINLDPILFTDQTTGRTFAGGLAGECSLLAFTDDDGQHWTTMTDPCAPPVVDHETIGTGPWHEPRPAQATSDRGAYYCVQTRLAECAVSWDGGMTFLPPALINSDLQCWGLFGHVKVATDGVAYVPIRSCSGPTGVALSSSPRPGIEVTMDNGATWATQLIADGTTPSNAFDPSVATTPSGFVVAAWTHGDGHPRAALSRDHGAHWGASTDLGASVGVRTAVFSAAVAGDDDRAAVAFIGTTDAGNAFSNAFAGSWDLYVATTYDAGATWTTVKATSDPVQRGWVCTAGTTCTEGRNLLDFIDATLDAQGHVLVGFADGCLDGCVAANSTAARASVARQSGGTCLYAASACGTASGTPIPNAPTMGDECVPNLVVFSSNSHGTPAINSHAGVCLVESFTGPAPVNTAFINPGSDQVSARYVGDLGVPTLVVEFNGLGADHVVRSMPRAVGTLGVTYDSPQVPIDLLARGDIVARVTLPDGTFVSAVRFHTVA